MINKIHKILIANRGEIAIRVIRAAHELGLKTVVVYSEADRDSLAVRLADFAIPIGHSLASKSYLNIDAILRAAIESGADAVHPGYGFLSENADFATKVVAAGLVFIGPTPEIIYRMGNKSLARKAAAHAGVPTVPGSDGVVKSQEEALEIAEKIGYPIMIKASSGGGGRGIRIASNSNELCKQFAISQTEAKAAFNDPSVYLERFINHARHIEVQILGDGQNVIHLYDRECSLQRRRQKILEEAPSPALSIQTRKKLCDSAVRLAKSIGYRGAGTIEYLYDSDSGEFFFIEMNTRIQVEHPITEMITGVDLVREMIRIANNEPLRFSQEDIKINGSSIECRINAEDPDNNFMPCPGYVKEIILPGGPGVRVDTMLFSGCAVPPYYDSLVAKLIVHDESRINAISRMRRALNEFQIDGLQTTRNLHKKIISEHFFQAADYDNNTLEQWLFNHL